jgi:hypothetical protein
MSRPPHSKLATKVSKTHKKFSPSKKSITHLRRVKMSLKRLKRNHATHFRPTYLRVRRVRTLKLITRRLRFFGSQAQTLLHRCAVRRKLEGAVALSAPVRALAGSSAIHFPSTLRHGRLGTVRIKPFSRTLRRGVRRLKRFFRRFLPKRLRRVRRLFHLRRLRQTRRLVWRRFLLRLHSVRVLKRR